MSYTPTEWQTGDTITAEKLNKLENGVASGGDSAFEVIFEYDYETEKFSSNKTAREICEAVIDGKTIRMYDTWNWATASPIVNGWFLPEDGEEAYSEITLSYVSDGKICFVFTVKDENNETTVEYKEATIEETKLRVDISYHEDTYTTFIKKGEVRSCNYRIEGSISSPSDGQRITLSYNDALGFYYFLPSQTPGQIILRSINYVGDDSSQQLQKTDYALAIATSLKKAAQQLAFSVSFDAGEYSKRVQVIIPVDSEDAFEGKMDEFGWYQIYQYRTDHDWPEDYCVIWNPKWWHFNDNNDKMYVNFWVTRASASTAQTFSESGQIECYYI